MADPSALPSAVSVSRSCFDEWQAIEQLPPNLRDNIDALAGHFHHRGDFISIFQNRLVPWDDLCGPPNSGHAAIADLLVTKSAHGAMSANFDTMIERWAMERKINLEGALDGQEATAHVVKNGPLLKFHGCMTRGKANTLWTEGQLLEPSVAARVTSCSDWMTLHLPGKHIVVVGFWTDWGYLNQVLADAFTIQNAASVTVVDPLPTADLQAKAPDLWAKLNALSAHFEHVSRSGAEFLDDVRTEFSRAWSRKFFSLGAPLATAQALTVAPTPNGLDGDQLYDLRRDVEGIPYTRAATLKAPLPASAETALAHYEFEQAGATKNGSWWQLGGKSVRVVNGAGRGLEDVKSKFREPTTMVQPDIVMCVGAVETGVPARIIASGLGASIMRPAAGGGAEWMTRAAAKVALGI